MKFIDFAGVGEATVKAFAKYNLNDPQDLLTVFPKEYKDTRHTTSIKNLVSEKKFLIEGRVSNITYKKFGKKFLRFVVSDDTGFCTIIMFRFYPNQIAMLERANKIRCYGKVDMSLSPQMVHPEWAVVKDGQSSLKQELSAVYSIKKVSNKIIGQIVAKLLQNNQVRNILPNQLLRKYDLMSFVDALYYVHALTNSIDDKYLVKAKDSIKIEEMIAYRLAEESVRNDLSEFQAPQISLNPGDKKSFYSKLPYKLTGAQDRTIAEILADLKQDKAMIRLLQGDVGAGKTIVATMALYATVRSGYQAAIMAPTEILAEQHYNFLSEYFSGFGIEVVPLLGKLTAKQTRDSLEKIKNFANCIVVGTHAIFQDRVEYKGLGLVVVDEQHRFGVEQRLALINKSSAKVKQAPHQLIISATPIPRTLAMTLYGNLKLSILDELPPNRKPIVTTVLNRTKKQSLVLKIKEAISRGDQVYWVCPLVEESENMDFLQDVKTLYKELCDVIGQEVVGLVYGSMRSKDKVQQMEAFKVKQYQVLVATTVIEVGVDVPNASIMIIDNSERLGISQLHQLRGRVGRGAKESYCILMYSDKISEVGKKRLSLIRDSQDGFYLAQKDLEIRGAGDVLGKEQSGISTFRTFDINEYYDCYERVTQLAAHVEQEYPAKAKELIARWFSKRIDYVEV